MDLEFNIVNTVMKEMCFYNVGYEMENKFECAHVINQRMKTLLGISKVHMCLWTQEGQCELTSLELVQSTNLQAKLSDATE